MDSPNTSPSSEEDHAARNESGSDVPGDPEEDARQGEGSEDSAGGDGPITRNGKKAKAQKSREAPDLSDVPTPTALHPLIRSVTNAQLEERIAHRMLLYKCDALDAVWHLATMKIHGKTPAYLQIKYAAAKLLLGPEQEAARPMDDTNDMLKRLNDAYHQKAPRIKSVRERVVTFESEPEALPSE